VKARFERGDAGLGASERILRAVRRWLGRAGYWIVLSVIAAVASDGGALSRYGARVTLPAIAIVMLLGCVLAGVIAGILTPLAVTLAGTLLASVVSLIPLALAVAAAFRPGVGVSAALFGVVLGSVLLGGIYGVFDWIYRES